MLGRDLELNPAHTVYQLTQQKKRHISSHEVNTFHTTHSYYVLPVHSSCSLPNPPLGSVACRLHKGMTGMLWGFEPAHRESSPAGGDASAGRHGGHWHLTRLQGFRHYKALGSKVRWTSCSRNLDLSNLGVRHDKHEHITAVSNVEAQNECIKKKQN